MYGGSSYSFTYDRFCNAYSAIYFNIGYLQVPSGAYFKGDFTVTAWIKLISFNQFSQIIDFGNGNFLNNVMFGLSSLDNLRLLMIGSKFEFESVEVNVKNFLYFNFFFDCFMGVISAVTRLTKAVIIAILMLPSNNFTIIMFFMLF